MDDPSKLLTYIVPGYLTIWVYRNLRPNKRRSDLELTLWAILWSSLFTFVTSFFYGGLAAWIHSRGVPFLGQQVLARVLLASVTGFVVGGIAGSTLKLLSGQAWFLGFLRWIAEQWGFNALSNFKESRVWNQVMARQPGRAWAIVTLQSGIRYLGYVEQYTLDPNVDQLEMHLTYYSEVIKDQNGADVAVKAEGFSDIWIPASQIVTVQFFDDETQERLSGAGAAPPPAVAAQAEGTAQLGPGSGQDDKSSGPQGISNPGPT